MSIAFVDTSVVLRFVLDDQRLAEAVSRIADCCSSIRVYLLDEEIEQTAAGPFPTVIGTLDALRLACARALGFATPLAEEAGA